ncbi:PLP-dependent aminotransferase family protein [Aneurinibacillus uraniidurans]|uniref:MocR-like pyridoxine biosynthesis transcription factor PdxR n=1 Tax=Aneurinibacillus uraniidurans TaxID=2966586 RepID=UPI00234B56D8|nr:PLP-dependent aminotransferase family protein [Aneurinibacillus sp. B1]WCN37376.1 PLP-dependent aminotransferase family protein [Aneurinibacillus sp. B1]
MLWLSIDRNLDASLTRQVYEQIRFQILNGIIHVGEKLPSTRELASELKISRNVILDAYDQLFAEGFIEGSRGSGTYVSEGTFLEDTSKYELVVPQQEESSEEKTSDLIDFRSGIPALNLFPKKKWSQLTQRMLADHNDFIFGYGHPEGRMELRVALCNYLHKTRGIRCSPEQLVITSGATQALSLVSKLLLTKGDEVCIEDPITHDIQTIFQQPGVSLYPVPVDEFGMITDMLPSNKKPKFIFVTPSHQFPLGGTLPIQRRIQLIQYARESGAYIVEDDYDSEFRYAGPPVSSLQSLEPERVIYIGTVSKILSPALRIGYLILPQNLIHHCRELKWFNDLHSPTFEQLTLAVFVKEGHLEQHIRKMKKVYRKRRDFLITCLHDSFSKGLKIYGDSTGLHMVAAFDNVHFSEETVRKVEESNIRIYPVEKHSIRKGRHQNKIILGYSNLSPDEIKEGIRRLAMYV